MDKSELVLMLRAPVFGDRGTDVIAAFDYAESIINALSGSSDRGPVWTAVHVLANTIANAIEALPDPLAAPPAEVRISPEDNPAAGASDLETMIIRLIDARIAHQRTDPAGDIDIKIETAIDDFVDNRLDDKIEGWVEHNLDFADIVRDELRNNISFSIEVD